MKNNSALLEAAKLLADFTGSCPCDMKDWHHPDTCTKTCKNDIEPECWAMYAKHLAANGKEKNNASV